MFCTKKDCVECKAFADRANAITERLTNLFVSLDGIAQIEYLTNQYRITLSIHSIYDAEKRDILYGFLIKDTMTTARGIRDSIESIPFSFTSYRDAFTHGIKKAILSAANSIG